MRLGRAAWAVPSAFAVAVLAAVPARAQAPAPVPAPAPAPAPASPSATDSRALAETLFFTARGMMEAGRYAEACSKLNESYRLDPAAGTLLNLAVCNEKIGKIASAWGEFRDALADAKRMSREDRIKLAEERIAAIQPLLPFLTISVPAQVRSVPGLELTRNGVPLNPAAWDTELPVDPGDTEVVERAPGYKPRTLHVNVANQQHATLAAEPLELAPIERPPAPFWTGRRTSGLILIGAGVIGAAAGAIFGVGAVNDKKQSDNECPVTVFGRQCTQGGVDSMNKASTEAIISDVGFGLAAVGVVLGSYFFFTGGEKERPAAPPPTAATSGAWSWHVGGGPGAAMGSLTRSF